MSGASSWRYVGASVPGVAHLADDLDCQDAWAAQWVDSDSVLVLAVADGAGSAAESRAGAELACQTVLAECVVWLSDPLVGDWTPAVALRLLQRVQLALAQQAAQAGQPIRELACTLLGAVLATDRALFLQVGDGAIVIGAGAGYRPVFWPQGGEYPNETHFVTDPTAVAQLECVILTEPVAEVALLTDGLQSLALHYHSRQAHLPFFRPLFQRLRDYPALSDPAELTTALERFLSSPAINQRTHDDKTLILAVRWPVEEPIPPPDAAAPDRVTADPAAVGLAVIPPAAEEEPDAEAD
ncbi:MAG: protein phosphatase 2C domain-containing protein [Candidatus Contendobacter sp.]|nr:protein phosphatase 2C domain-containing protein [Candidatus Contendobacter sp.]